MPLVVPIILSTLLSAAAVQATDPSQIAVIEADTAILEPAHAFPFGGQSLDFTPTADGYALRIAPVSFDEQGERSVAYGMEPAEVDLPFPFRFFGREYRKAYAYVHGVVLFEKPESVEHRVYPEAFTRQPPLISALWQPAGGDPPGVGPKGIYVNASMRDRVVITWFQVMPAYVESILNTFQVTLFRDGAIRVAYQQIQHPEGIVGLSTGDTLRRPTEVRLRSAASETFRASFYEWFRQPQYDPRNVARAFYRTHPDSFDALVIFENFPASHTAAASHALIKNEIRGIGQELVDRTPEYGSPGRLQSILRLNHLDRYPDDFASGMLAHEFGHRWLAFVSFMDGSEKSWDLLEGERGSHWCLYFDTRAGEGASEGRRTLYHSFLGGTRWEERDPGQFEDGMSTAGGYSQLDLYLMGLIPPSEVPELFYVADRPGQGPGCTQAGAESAGRKKVVTIQQIIAAEGPRDPDAIRSPKRFRMAFVLLVRPGQPASPAELSRLDRIRVRWERDFAQYTRGLGTVDTRLRAGPDQAEPKPVAAAETRSAPSWGRFQLVSTDRGFVLRWSAARKKGQAIVPREWLIPRKEEAAERGNPVSSFRYDQDVTAFPIGDGSVGLHVSSFEAISEDSSQVGSGRDAFIIFDPASGQVVSALLFRGPTKWRARSGECFGAEMSHFLLADIDQDGFIDIGRVTEELRCSTVTKSGGERIPGPLYVQRHVQWHLFRGPLYVQRHVQWHLFRVAHWKHAPNLDGKLPAEGGYSELPLVGMLMGPVDVAGYQTWGTYDVARWKSGPSQAPQFVPTYRRQLWTTHPSERSARVPR